VVLSADAWVTYYSLHYSSVECITLYDEWPAVNEQRQLQRTANQSTASSSSALCLLSLPALSRCVCCSCPGQLPESCALASLSAGGCCADVPVLPTLFALAYSMPTLVVGDHASALLLQLCWSRFTTRGCERICTRRCEKRPCTCIRKRSGSAGQRKRRFAPLLRVGTSLSSHAVFLPSSGVGGMIEAIDRAFYELRLQIDPLASQR
jgi:hypothetical protein